MTLPHPMLRRLALAFAAAVLLTMVLLVATSSADAAMRVKVLSKPDKMFVCDPAVESQPRVLYVKVKVTPAVRGQKVFISRIRNGKFVKDEARAVTNSAGIAEIKWRPRCTRDYIGKRTLQYAANVWDKTAKRWSWARPMKMDFWRLTEMQTAGFEDCVNLPVTEPCIFAASPTASAFNIYNDNYYIEVVVVQEDGSLGDVLEIFDAYGNQGPMLEILEDPFALGILPFGTPATVQVQVWLYDNKTPVGVSETYTISWA